MSAHCTEDTVQDRDVPHLLDRYYSATHTAEQEAVIAALGRVAGEPTAKSDVWVPAVQALIELLHVVRHPRERVRVVRGFAHCFDRAFAVPSLLAELDEPEEDIVEAALWALGRIGVHFAGSAVGNWLDGADLDALPEAVLDRALLTLAEIGVPDAPQRAEACWQRGQITAEIAHLVMAESVSRRMEDAAVEHLADPETARAAALHLAMVGHPDLDERLAERMVGARTELSLVMHQLLEPRRGRKGGGPGAGDLLLDAVSHPHPIRRRRLARRLRALPVGDVLEGFAEVADLVAGSGGDPHPNALISAALNAGIPELQDAVLDYAQGNEYHLQHALRQAHSATPRLLAGLDEWTRHEKDWVAINAVRARSSTCGPEGLAAIAHLVNAERSNLRVEWVRAQQNAWMLQRDTKGRIPVDHADRQALVREIRRIVHTDPPPQEQKMALYLIGNLDLNELAEELLDAVRQRADPLLRRAAANSMGELELPRLVEHYADLIANEHEEEVLFRLFRAALRGLPVDGPPQPALSAAVRARLSDGLSPRLECAAIALIGRCKDRDAVAMLSERAGSEAQIFGGAAITALGEVGDTKGLAALIAASRHPEIERRIRAASALGGVGGEVAQDRLVNLLQNEAEIPVRRAALAGLQASRPASGILERLAPLGADDPLAIEILHLRLSATRAQTGVDSDEIDARLMGAIPGFETKRVAATSPDALKSFRAAEYLSSLHENLPAGFDASAPVLLWNKGLEVWLNHLLRDHMLEFVETGGTACLENLVSEWWKLQPVLAPKWRDDLLRKETSGLWEGLAWGLKKQLRSRTDVTRRSQSLPCVATLLLACAVPWEPGGFRWKLGLEQSAIQLLANNLVVLARERNLLTHQRAGGGAIREAARGLAHRCMGIASQIRVR